MGVVLQERDREIINICYEQMFISVAQVQRYFFKSADKRRARERVLELARSGYVSRTKVYGETPNSLLQLTRDGYSLAEKRNLLSLRYISKINFRTIEHDLRLIDIRFRLAEKWTNYRWVPERAIRRAEYPEVPDALCLFKSGKTIAIELENSAKGEDRIIKLLSRWRTTNISLVLYFATSDEVFRKYQKILSSHDFDAAIGLIDLNEFLTSFPTAWSKNGPIRIFTE